MEAFKDTLPIVRNGFNMLYFLNIFIIKHTFLFFSFTFTLSFAFIISIVHPPRNKTQLQ